MPTSKLPVEIVDVPEVVIQFAASNPDVHCNVRPSQRPLPTDERERRHLALWGHDDGSLAAPIRSFLKGISSGARLAVHFQGFGPEIGTAVMELRDTYWTREEDYPKLDFDYSFEVGGKMEKIYGSQSFWGAFILAIALVGKTVKIHARPDPSSRHFIDIVRCHGLRSPA